MTPDHLSSTFAALADPTRRAILARLASGEAPVTELAKPFDMSMPAVSKAPQGAGARGTDRPQHGKRSGDPAGSRQAGSRKSPTGWSTTAVSGSKASIVWTIT